MNSFFSKLKNCFKLVIQKIREAAIFVAGKIAMFAEKVKHRFAVVISSIKRSIKNLFKHSAKATKNSDKKQKESNSYSTGGFQSEQKTDNFGKAADFSQQTQEKSNFREKEADNTNQTEQSCKDDTTKTAQESKSKKDAKTKSKKSFDADKKEQSRIKVRYFFMHFVDFLAGLMLFSAVVITFKPQLLNTLFGQPSEFLERETFQYTEKIGNYLIQLKIMQPISGELKFVRNVLVVLFLVMYVILKFTAVLLTKVQISQKIVSVLMVALTIIACTLPLENPLIFIIICIIASFAFAFSCGFPVRTIFKKFILFIIIALCYYVTVHILVDYDNCRELLRKIGNAFVQVGENFVKFLKTLSIEFNF